MPLIVPIRAEHIRAAYADAQEDPDGFIHREIQRLRDAHPLLAAQIEGTFDMHMRHDGHSWPTPITYDLAVNCQMVSLPPRGTQRLH